MLGQVVLSVADMVEMLLVVEEAEVVLPELHGVVQVVEVVQVVVEVE
jgi:hypothetical protein